jgi:hypothetical protein
MSVVLMILKVPGDPAKLKASYEERFTRIEERPMPAGVLHHIVTFPPDGMHVYDVWESEEAMNANFADKSNAQMQQKVGNAAWGDRDVTVEEVYNILPDLGAEPAWGKNPAEGWRGE